MDAVIAVIRTQPRSEHLAALPLVIFLLAVFLGLAVVLPA